MKALQLTVCPPDPNISTRAPSSRGFSSTRRARLQCSLNSCGAMVAR
eukprot:CAMPEP_0185782504 /NCGR_PEP_ID=MMETSP1174-20130828/109336_1 /TAXON_ID=35687 /ORGANISM="Dictyocha speculum, Strain CCMP1381" /LENGTH=46 /DNA_ID= /DNA_START= /DNA_END= /DNA_ORIENTATION=